MKRKAKDTGSAVKKSKLDEPQSSNTVGTPGNEMNNELVTKMITERNETSSDSDLKQPLHCIMEQQKAEREAMALQQQELLTRMMEMVQTRSEAKTELNAQTVEETLIVSMKDPIIQSNGINDEIRKCMMEPQKSEREAMTQKEFWTKMQEIVQLGLKETTEINAVNCAETPSVSMKDLIMQSTGTNVEIPEMAFYQDFINIANPTEKAASSKPGLTLDALSGYAENDQTYTQYKKLKDLEGINIIKIPGRERFTFDKMDFESKDQIYCDTKVIVELYRYKPTNTEMAVKFLRIPFSFSNDESKFESFFKKIQREMNTCKEIPSSPNLVELYGFCIYGGYILICMEYMDMSLYDLYKQMHKKYGHFPHELLGIIAVSIVDALNDLNSKNIMHRDIKPQNILINRQGQIKLCDFGVSRILVDSHATTVTIGTALYWPPERFEMSGEDAKYDIRADVWSLGITLIELLKGKHPYGIDGENKIFPYTLIQEAINNFTIEDAIPQDLPNNLKEFIENCLRSFKARLSYTELISSSLYIQYKKIARTVVVELIGQTMLHWAAQVNKWDVVQWLVEHGVDVNVKGVYGMTVLHWAAQVNNWNVVQWLVEHGADVNFKRGNGGTVLHCAAQDNKWDVVQWLVEHGADVNVKDVYGMTVLHWAAWSNLDVVQWLVEQGKANVDAIDNYNRTVLHWAAQRNKLDVVQWLVKHGKANVEATDNNGQTVLYWAAQGTLDVAQWLVEHAKANVEAKNKLGQTVLHMAAYENKLDFVQWFVEHGKANVEATDKYGWTVLHWAAWSNLDIVQWLVEHGKANVDAIDNYNRTVLHWAAQKNKLDVVQWLVKHGADVNATDKDGKTPLNLAEERKHTKMTEYFKKR